jgi:hypothetical protein
MQSTGAFLHGSDYPNGLQHLFGQLEFIVKYKCRNKETKRIVKLVILINLKVPLYREITSLVIPRH